MKISQVNCCHANISFRTLNVIAPSSLPNEFKRVMSGENDFENLRKGFPCTTKVKLDSKQSCYPTYYTVSDASPKVENDIYALLKVAGFGVYFSETRNSSQPVAKNEIVEEE